MRLPLRIDILTTFPEMFAAESPAALGVSIPGRARSAGLVQWQATNIRDFTHDKHQKTDDRPFGGGPGMVMMCQPIWDAVHAVEALDDRPAARVLLTPQGRPMTQGLVEELADRDRLLLICGHYEGIDERVIRKLDPLEVSIGDYVLSGGELAAMVLMDAVIRLLPGALGDGDSTLHESFGQADQGGIPGEETQVAAETAFMGDAAGGGAAGGGAAGRLLDCPHYTRPRVWEGMEVPEVLLSGDHGAIARWRLQRRIERTRVRRPDLLGEAEE